MNTPRVLSALLATALLAHADVLPPAQDSSSLNGKLTALTGKAGTLPVTATRKGFVLFNLGNLPADVQATDIVNARLRVYFPLAKKPGIIAIHTAEQAWNETTTAPEPAISAQVTSIPLEAVLGKKFAEIDVTPTVQAWVAGTAVNNGFAFVASGLTNVTLGAKEGSGSGYPCELDLEIQRDVTVADGSIGATQLAPNLTLGGTTTGTFSGDGSGLTNIDVSNTIGDGSISNMKLANSALTITAGTGLSGGGSVALGGTTTLSLGSSLTLGGTTTFSGTALLPAGTTTLAPLRLQTGAKLTTPVFGAVEFDGTNLFLTNNGGTPTRKTIAFTDTAVTGAQLPPNLTLGGTTAGTFSGPLTGNVTGNVSGSAASFTGSLAGNVTGPQNATIVATVGGVSASSVAAGANLANLATNANTPSTIVKRDASGNFAAGTITGTLTGNVTGNLTGNVTGNVTGNAGGSAASFTGSLAGNVTGTQGATFVATVGGVTAANLASGANFANAATNVNTVGTIVKRDASGNFAAGTITGNLTGNASGSAASFTGSLAGNVTGTQGATVVATVGGVTAANVATGTNLANAATNVNTASTIVKRDASGNFAAGTITGNLTGNAGTASALATARTINGVAFDGTANINVPAGAGTLTGTTLGASVIGSSLTSTGTLTGGATGVGFTIALDASTITGTLANARTTATSANTANTIVLRSATGAFTAGTITATAFVGDGSGLTNLPSSGGGLVLKDGNGVTLGKVVAAYKTGATILTSTGYLIDITFDGIMFPAQIYYAGTNGTGNAILNDGFGGTLSTPPRFTGKYIVYSGSRASLQEPNALTNGIEVSIAMSTQSIDNPTVSNFAATTNSGQLLKNITNTAAGLPAFISAGKFQVPITIQ